MGISIKDLHKNLMLNLCVKLFKKCYTHPELCSELQTGRCLLLKLMYIL